MLPKLHFPKTPKPNFSKKVYIPDYRVEKPQSQSTSKRDTVTTRPATEIRSSIMCLEEDDSNQKLLLQAHHQKLMDISKKYYHYDADKSKEESKRLRARLYKNVETFISSK